MVLHTEKDASTSFFFNDTATTEIYTLSLHDALPIYARAVQRRCLHHRLHGRADRDPLRDRARRGRQGQPRAEPRSEEHTSELQSRQYLVCRLLLEKKNYNPPIVCPATTARLHLYRPS